MSKIEFDLKDSVAQLINCKEILGNKISKVCSRIGFDDSKITWIVFDPNEKEKENFFAHIRGYYGCDYGYCVPEINKIWISTLSIMKDDDASPLKKIHSQLKLLLLNKEDFLANVIIDEITHIQTGSDHGSEKYDTQLRENLISYYLSPKGQAVLKI